MVATSAAAESPTLSQAGRPRLVRVESLRAIAALSVVGAHVFAYAHGWRPEIFRGAAHRLIMGGGFGVQLFFALSGFLLYRPFARRDFGGGGDADLRTYARNRALRLLPLYWSVVIVLLLVTQRGGSWGQWWRFMTFSEEFSTHTAQRVDGPMWSLVVELHFYLLLPLIAWGLAKLARGRVPVAVALLSMFGVLSVAFRRQGFAPAVIWQYSLPATFYAFVPGLVLAILQPTFDRPASRDRSPLWKADIWLVSGALFWALAALFLSVVEVVAIGSFLVVGATVLPLDHGPLVRALDHRLLAVIGVASYSLYLWHVPLIEHAITWSFVPAGSVGLMIVVLPISLAVAAISYWLIERPALRLRKTWTSSGAALAARGSEYATTASDANVDPTATPSSQTRLQPGSRLKTASSRWPVLLATAIAVRVAAVIHTRTLHLAGDAVDYDRLARLLAHGRGFGPALLSPSGGPTAFRAPLYPMFLAPIYRLTGNSIAAARIAEAILGTVTVGLIGWLGNRLFGPRVGVIAAWLAALYPPLVLSSVSLLTESVFVPLELAAIATALVAQEQASPWNRWTLATGVGAGLAILARPNGAVIVIPLAILASRRRRTTPATTRRPSWRRTAAISAVVPGVAVLVLAPWLIRNQLAFHRFVPVTDADGFNVAGVYNDVSAHADYPIRYHFRPPSAVPAESHWFSDHRLNELTLSDQLRRDGLSFIQNHPLAVPAAMLWNSYRMLELGGPAERNLAGAELGYGQRLALVAAIAFWVILALAAAGLALGGWRRVPKSLLLIPAGLWLVTVPFLGNARLRVPVEPFAVLLGAIAIEAALGFLRQGPGVDLDRRRLEVNSAA